MINFDVPLNKINSLIIDFLISIKAEQQAMRQVMFTEFVKSSGCDELELSKSYTEALRVAENALTIQMKAHYSSDIEDTDSLLSKF